MKLDSHIKSYSLTVKNNLSDLGNIVEAIGVLAIKWDLPSKFVHQINLAVEEVISNIIFYAYTDKEEHEIRIVFSLVNNQVLIKVTDDGKYFNILEASNDVDLEANVEDRMIGGLGIHILKQMVDDLDYERNNNMNILKLSKQL